MKKKNPLMICLFIILILGIIILPFFFGKDAMKNNYSKSEWSTSISVKDGVVSPAFTVSDFTVYKDAAYRLSYGWMPEGVDRDKIAETDLSVVPFITAIQIFDSKGEQVFATSAGCVYGNPVIELSAGQYRAEYSYFTDRESFKEFAKENLCAARNAQALADGVAFENLGNDPAVTMKYSMGWETVGQDSVFSVWILLIIVLITLIVIALAKSTIPDEYDERQQFERGRAFRMGFFTLLMSMGAALTLDILELLPVQSHVLYAAAIFPGIMVYVVYSVWHEAYFSMNQKAGSLMVMFGFIGVANLILGISSILDGRIMEGGRISVPVMNLICALMFLVLFVVIFLKKMKSAKEADDESEE